jgi:spore maturation protein SpmB
VNKAKDPTAIVLPAFLATCIAACSGVCAAKFLERLPIFKIKPDVVQPATEKSTTPSADATSADKLEVEKVATAPLRPWGGAALVAFIGCFIGMWVRMVWFAPLADSADKPEWLRGLLAISVLAVPFLLSFFPLYACLRGVKVYEQFCEGAKEAFGVGMRIIPFLVAMLVAIRLLREAGVIALLTEQLTPLLATLRFPPDLLPMVLMRPLSGSATQGIFVELVQHLGADNLVSRMAATIYGSTETTFYVLAVYFGSVAVRQTRHAVLAGLTADTVAVIASITICRLFFA